MLQSKRFSKSVFSALVLTFGMVFALQAQADSNEYRVNLRSLSLDMQKYDLKAGDHIFLRMVLQMSRRDNPPSEEMIRLIVGAKGEVYNLDGTPYRFGVLPTIYPADGGYVQISLWKKHDYPVSLILELCHLQNSTGKCIAQPRYRGHATPPVEVLGLNFVLVPVL